MPIYAYRCESCGHAQDVLQKISDPVLDACPACRAPSFRKQLTAAGFQLKGSGWYATDFKANGGKAPAAPGDKATSPDAQPAAGSDKPSDAGDKPAASAGTASSAPGACGSGCACH